MVQAPAYTAPDAGAGSTVFGDTMVQYVSCRGGPLVVVVWSDFSDKDQRTAGFGGENGYSTNLSGQTELHSSLKGGDGRAVLLKAATTDGKTWTVTVNGKEYRLDEGALFLARTRGPSVKVTQVKHDLSGLSPTKETWQRLAKENPQVKEFIAQAGARE